MATLRKPENRANVCSFGQAYYRFDLPTLIVGAAELIMRRAVKAPYLLAERELASAIALAAGTIRIMIIEIRQITSRNYDLDSMDGRHRKREVSLPLSARYNIFPFRRE
jgi:hypothetical protein